MKGLPIRVRQLLDKSREAAMLAVDVYNKPATSFKSGAYIVLMVIAWTSLLHAIFERRKTPFYYRKKNSKRYEKVGGDKKAWELKECVATYYGSNNPPERKNLELFIELRNKIEHRFLPQLDPEIAGECQALLMNYEEVLVSEFGARSALASDLAFPLQVTRIRSAGRSTAQKKLQAKEFGRVKSFLDQYRAALDPEVWNGSQFSFRVFLIPKIGNRPGSSDLAVEFVKYDESKPQEMDHYQRVLALIKERQIPVANAGLLKPGTVVKRVGAQLGRPFNMHHHMVAWRHFAVRPPSKSPNPASCDPKFCRYDSAHADYLYTEDWVKHLVDQFSDQGRYDAVFKRH